MGTPLLKRIAVGCVVALLLIAGYYWIQSDQVQPSSPVAGSEAAISVTTDTVAVLVDSSSIDTASTAQESARKKPPVAASPARAFETNEPVDDRPVESAEESEPVEAPRKPAAVVCDQLVMRDGDLIDAKILEIGVDEIRYRKCRREDGPDYVVPKSDVLSIRYANGDIERFTSRTTIELRNAVALGTDE